MLFVVNKCLRLQELCRVSPQKGWSGNPLLQPRQEGPRDGHGSAAHPRVLGDLGGSPRPTCPPPRGGGRRFALVPDRLWGGDGVSRRGRGRFFGVFFFCNSRLALPCLGVSCFSYIVAWESCVTVKRVTISLSELLPSRCRVLESSQQTSTADTLPTCSFSHPSTCTYLNNQKT